MFARYTLTIGECFTKSESKTFAMLATIILFLCSCGSGSLSNPEDLQTDQSSEANEAASFPELGMAVGESGSFEAGSNPDFLSISDILTVQAITDTQLEQLEEELQIAEQIIIEKEQEVVQSNLRLGELSDNLQTAELDLIEAQEGLTTTEIESVEFQNAVSNVLNLQQEISNLQSEYAAQIERNESLNQELSESKDDFENARNEIDRLESQLSANEVANENTQQQLTELNPTSSISQPSISGNTVTLPMPSSAQSEAQESETQESETQESEAQESEAEVDNPTNITVAQGNSDAQQLELPTDSSINSLSSSEESPVLASAFPDLAFPGAVGHGRFATGGRAGRVVIVNTLDDIVDNSDELVSLREALTVMNEPRIVVFDVGGVFDTGSQELILEGEADSNITVACQTAPKPGVIIKGSGLRIKGGAHNIVMRHCAIRNIDPGFPASEASRAIGVVGTTKGVNNMIFDHMSLSWATDENFTVFTGPSSDQDSSNFTLSNSIISEGDSDSSHTESGKLPGRYVHAMGPSCNSNSDKYRIENCSIMSNFISNNARRNPLIVSSSAEIQHNIVYNWHEIATHAWPYKNDVDVHISDNLYKAGPTSKSNSEFIQLSGDQSVARYKATSNTKIELFTNDVTNLPEIEQGTPGLSISSGKPININCVGATKPMRDYIDDRLISEYEAGTGEVGIGNNHERDYSGYWDDKHPSAYDSDRDGMSDAWELEHGLNPNDSEDYRGDLDGDGYTNLEEFINTLAHCE